MWVAFLTFVHDNAQVVIASWEGVFFQTSAGYRKDCWAALCIIYAGVTVILILVPRYRDSFCQHRELWTWIQYDYQNLRIINVWYYAVQCSVRLGQWTSRKGSNFRRFERSGGKRGLVSRNCKRKMTTLCKNRGKIYITRFALDWN